MNKLLIIIAQTFITGFSLLNTNNPEVNWAVPSTNGAYAEPVNGPGSNGFSVLADTGDVCRVILAGTNSGVNILTIGGTTNSLPEQYRGFSAGFFNQYLQRHTNEYTENFQYGPGVHNGYTVNAGAYMPAIASQIISTGLTPFTQIRGYLQNMVSTNGLPGGGSNPAAGYMPDDGGVLDYSMVGFNQTGYVSDAAQRVFNHHSITSLPEWAPLASFTGRCELVLVGVLCCVVMWGNCMFLMYHDPYRSIIATGQEFLGVNVNIIAAKWNLLLQVLMNSAVLTGTISWMTTVAGEAAFLDLSGSPNSVTMRIFGPNGINLVGYGTTAVGTGAMAAAQRFLLGMIPLNQIEIMLSTTIFGIVSVWVIWMAQRLLHKATEI